MVRFHVCLRRFDCRTNRGEAAQEGSALLALREQPVADGLKCRRRAILSGNSRAILSSAPKPFCHIKKSDAVSIAPGKPHKSLMSLPSVALSSLWVKPDVRFFSSGFVFDSCGRITTAQSRRLYLNNSTATMTAILQSWRRFPRFSGKSARH